MLRTVASAAGDGVWNCGPGGENFARRLLRDHQAIHGNGCGLYVRDISQWREIPDA